jgi:RNA polymerase sigma-70 factor (ECF subfamily)
MSSFEAQMAGWLYPPDKVDGGPEVRGLKPGGHGVSDASANEDSDQAIAELVEQYAQPLYRVAYSVMRNAAEAEDAVQETFLRVLKNRNRLPEVRDARVWLVRITWNVVLDRKRRSKVRPETDDIADLARVLPCSGLGSEASAIASQQCRMILNLIDRLPHKEREALLLSAVEELDTSEIASVLGASESSIRSRLFRARALLARLLDGAATGLRDGAGLPGVGKQRRARRPQRPVSTNAGSR